MANNFYTINSVLIKYYGFTSREDCDNFLNFLNDILFASMKKDFLYSIIPYHFNLLRETTVEEFEKHLTIWKLQNAS